MVSTTRLDRIADDLLDEARASAFGYTDPSGVPVAPMYRCEDMDRLPQGLQSDIVRKASWAVGSSRAYLLAALGCIAVALLAFVLADMVLGASLPYPMIFMVVVWIPLLQLVLVRRAVRRIAARVAAGWPVATRI
ncbi:hypothetical protein [Massilia sp. 9I]|uniref:hypothetical protein n=1 Tax=Massilia sp. 9I TaxID=2653152 RepID=UPI0012F3E0FD|nr:hypothetical protein [Massilia sp. 9I]VXC55604.1 conserved hypothetical protein [Massilia sp. 9I]